jgi:hypothetical protein
MSTYSQPRAAYDCAKRTAKMTTPAIILTLSLLYCACKDSVNEVPIESEGWMTAACRMASVDSLAKAYGHGLGLMRISSGEVSAFGTSRIWYYEYESNEPPYLIHSFHATFNTIAFDGTSNLEAGYGGPVNQGWFDSDLALFIAEKNGGSDFRKRYPQCSTQSSLRQTLFNPPTTWWYVRYYMDSRDRPTFIFSINANTGKVSKMYYE